MDDNASKSSTSLVVAEKGVRKPGGCVGIFCKLFDWNRRFAKKKLFPKKLLAPSRGNKVSKKLVNENLLKTKHLLIDGDGDGNCYGKAETSAPGLVARLMGLDSLPVVKRQSSDESPFCGSGKPKSVGFVERLDKQVVSLEKGRKMKGFERHPMNRFGADAMHIKNVLSRSKKRHPKLASPVKSSRGSKNTIRLIGAATKILEPGLQATSRAKCALTYSNHMPQQPMNDEFIRLPVQSSSQVAAQSSCRNCGHVPRDGIKQNPTHCDRESEVVLLRSRYEPEECMVQEIPFAINGKKPSGLNGNSFIHQKRDDLVALNHRGSASSTSGLNYNKGFIGMNRNVSHPHFRFPRKPQYEVPQDDAFSTQGDIMTKKTTNVYRKVECSSSSSSVMDRERCLESKHMPGRRPRFGTCVKSQPCVQEEVDIDSVSFSYNSPLKSPSSNYVQRSVEESNRGVKTPSPLLMNEDALGTILAHKLKELAIQEENESKGVTSQARTANVIIQELISVLTAQRPTSPELNDSNSSYSALMNKPSQADARGNRLHVRFSGNHSSPGSVLDASFSNDSCISSSIDDSSGYMLQSDLMDLNDSKTFCNVPVSHLLDRISRALDRTNLPEMKLSTAYSAYTKEVLFNCELLFGDTNKSETFVDFLTGPFLNELETLAIAAWSETVISGFQISTNRGKRNSPLRKFLLDCLVECLSIRYDRYSNCGFVEWSRLPRKLNAEALIQLFDYEVRKTASLARRRMTTDEIIDWEMNASLAKWADFEVEMFESGAEIGLIIFQGLVDEIVADFVPQSGCFRFL